MLFLGQPNFRRFVVVLNERIVPSRYIVTHIIQKNSLEELSRLEVVIRSVPIYFVMKPLDHCGRKLHLAVSHHTSLQVFYITAFKGQGLQVVKRWRTTETTDFQNRGVALSNHAFPERLKKHFDRILHRHQATNCHFSLVQDVEKSYYRLTLVQRREIRLFEVCLFTQVFLKYID